MEHAGEHIISAEPVSAARADGSLRTLFKWDCSCGRDGSAFYSNEVAAKNAGENIHGRKATK